MDHTLSAAELAALVAAAVRARHNICPVIGSDGQPVDAKTEFAVLAALNQRGMIRWDESIAIASAEAIEISQRQWQG